MKQVISIGKQDFASLRDENYFFIDKSNFIKEWWEAGDEITLIARPRRFGKTLNMSMLNCFFSNKYAVGGGLFKGLTMFSCDFSKLCRCETDKLSGCGQQD